MKRFLATILLCLCIVPFALAEDTQAEYDFLTRAIALTEENGTVGNWPEDERLALAQGLATYSGASTSPKTTKEADALLKKMLGKPATARYTQVIEALKGNMKTWSLEDKAWYTNTLRDMGLYTDAWTDVLPGEVDMSREEALAIASAAVEESFSIGEETLATFTAEVSFFTLEDGDEPRWYITFSKDDQENFYQVLLTRKGEITSDASLGVLTPAADAQSRAADIAAAELYEKQLEEKLETLGEIDTWSVADKHFLGYPLPGEDDLTEEEVTETARAAVTETFELTEEDMDALSINLWFLKATGTNREARDWRVDFGTEEDYQQYVVMIDAADGTVTSVTEGLPE